MSTINKNQVIRIRLKSFDHRLLDIATKEIALVAQQTGSLVKGPIPLPTITSRLTILKGPHINKTARDQFECKVHKRLIDIYQPTDSTLDSLIKIELAAGVDVQISLC